MKCIISWMVRNRSFEASWGRPNCPPESVHRSLVLAHHAAHEPPRLAAGAQQVCTHGRHQAQLLHRQAQPLRVLVSLNTVGFGV